MLTRTLGYIDKKSGKYIKSDIIDKKVNQGEEHSHYREHVRKDMAREYARDLVQPWTEEFIEANPTKAKALGMVPESED